MKVLKVLVAFLLVVVVAVVTSGFSIAQEAAFRLESQNKVTDEGVAPRLSIFVTKPLAGKVSVTGFAFVKAKESYAEGYFGLAYQLRKWCSVEQNIGLEQSDSLLRLESSVFLGLPNTEKPKFTFAVVVEYGREPLWWAGQIKYQLVEAVGFGFMGRRYDGIGPMVDVKTPFGFIVYGAGLYDTEADESEEYSALIGVQRWF